MSRRIDPRKPLTDDDRQYLADREQHDMIAYADDPQEFEKQRDMTPEERAALQAQMDAEAKGKRTPALVDNSLVEQQIEQRQQTEEDQLEAMTADEYDPDDIAYVQQLNVDELKEQLRGREQPVTGNKPELQRRLLDCLRRESDESQND